MPLKIAHVVAAFPPDIGGMGQVALDEAKGLAERGYDVTVFCLSLREEYEKLLLPFKVERLRPLISGGAAGFLPDLRNKLSSFDLVHLHYPFYGGAEWVWLSGRPYVVTYHMDAEPKEKYKKVIKGLYDRVFSKKILQKAKRVILVDGNHIFKNKKDLFKAQVALIPNGVDTQIFKKVPVSPSEMGLKNLNNKDIFLFVGNFLPVKGLPLLLKIWKDLPESAHLIIIGAGYKEHEYRNLAAGLSLDERVHWLGPCFDPAQLAKYYSLAQATVVPSYSESFSLVSGESLSCGTPVVASDLLGVRGRVVQNETGLLFEKGSEESLKNSLQLFLKMDVKTKERMGEHGRELICKKFSLASHIDELEKVYQETL